jgi:Malectin domain
MAPVFQPILINCGGEEYTDSQERIWQADKFNTGGAVSRTGADILDTDSDELYRSERYGGEMTYSIPMGAGIYTITLHFAEI